MNERSYVGIDKTDTDDWIAVLWANGRAVYSRPFKNTPAELAALTRYIAESCDKPKICLNPTNPDSFGLIKFISQIPEVEVIFMSKAGFNLHLNWLGQDNAAHGQPAYQNRSQRAYLLACCAERMI
ncbi:MAG: hypothetical protein ABSB19_09220 [Methylomonas sp.]|jgi:hypothetical protein